MYSYMLAVFNDKILANWCFGSVAFYDVEQTLINIFEGIKT